MEHEGSKSFLENLNVFSGRRTEFVPLNSVEDLRGGKNSQLTFEMFPHFKEGHYFWKFSLYGEERGGESNCLGERILLSLPEGNYSDRTIRNWQRKALTAYKMAEREIVHCSENGRIIDSDFFEKVNYKL